MKISSPDTSYTGQSRYGETVLEFNDGVATFDGELPLGVRAYLQGAGYGLDADPAAVNAPPPADARDHAEQEQLGTVLRDAAVNPKPEDFLAPTNAGAPGPDGNPHGPNVVAPQIHGSTGQAVLPGPVGRYDENGQVIADTDAQEKREREYATRVLAGDEPVPEVTEEMGANSEPDPQSDTVPAGNASTEAWRTYARTQAKDSDEATAIDEMGRDELREKYSPAEPA